jgi:hypothetical protein
MFYASFLRTAAMVFLGVMASAAMVFAGGKNMTITYQNGNTQNVILNQDSSKINKIEFSGQHSVSSMEWDTDRMGSDYRDFDLNVADPAICHDACMKDPQCKAWTYVKPNTIQGPNPRCWLKNNVPNPIKSGCCVSGVK